MQIFSTGEHGSAEDTSRMRGWRSFSLIALVLAVLGGFSAPQQAQAQNLFAPVARVNDGVITAYELSQRVAFLTLLKAPGNVRDL
ncbi:MAG TPA: hypothetical protein ENK45_03285, partial [Aliiroseovarius sp.]|nr:hypothetical protein [Aliiroseovarius sp.]